MSLTYSQGARLSNSEQEVLLLVIELGGGATRDNLADGYAKRYPHAGPGRFTAGLNRLSRRGVLRPDAHDEIYRLYRLANPAAADKANARAADLAREQEEAQRGADENLARLRTFLNDKVILAVNGEVPGAVYDGVACLPDSAILEITFTDGSEIYVGVTGYRREWELGGAPVPIRDEVEKPASLRPSEYESRLLDMDEIAAELGAFELGEARSCNPS